MKTLANYSDWYKSWDFQSPYVVVIGSPPRGTTGNEFTRLRTKKEGIKKMIKKIEEKIKELGFVVGCYNDKIDDILTPGAARKVCGLLEEEYTDELMRIRGKLYKVCISTVDNEKDINIYPALDYYRQYGEEHLDNDYEEKIMTLREYKALKKMV